MQTPAAQSDGCNHNRAHGAASYRTHESSFQILGYFNVIIAQATRKRQSHTQRGDLNHLLCDCIPATACHSEKEKNKTVWGRNSDWIFKDSWLISCPGTVIIVKVVVHHPGDESEVMTARMRSFPHIPQPRWSGKTRPLLRHCCVRSAH